MVEGEAEVDVIVNDSTTYRGSVLGTDSVRDLAVVSICCGSFRALPFGDAATLQPGNEVVTIFLKFSTGRMQSGVCSTAL